MSHWIRKNLDGSKHLKWRPIRWATAVGLALCFMLSYGLDIQVLEGSMVASRFLGFHLVDLFSGLEVISAHGRIAINLSLGLLFIAIIYAILGGRAFCSWVCPFGLLSEWGEILHRALLKKGWIGKRKKLTTRYKYLIALAFLMASWGTGYLLYQYVNVVAILSRMLIYGLTETGLILGFILFIEIFFYRRLWCRSVCPSGATYGLLNKISVIRIRADKSQCDHCGACVSDCHAPEALSPVFNKKDGRAVFLDSTDCTLCARCMDACSRDVLHFDHRLKRFI